MLELGAEKVCRTNTYGQCWVCQRHYYPFAAQGEAEARRDDGEQRRLPHLVEHVC